MDSIETKHTIQKNNPLLIPAAIVLAGLLVAGAVIMTRGEGTSVIREQQNTVTFSFRAGDETDHILGSPNAEIFFVEYSDTECPFCQQFHPTVERLMEEFGKDAKLAWLYRHWPIHAKSASEAAAAECVAEISGNNAYYAFIKQLFERKDFYATPPIGVPQSELPKIAKAVGATESEFSKCVSSGKHDDKIKASYQEAIDAGGTGTPHSVFILKKKVSAEAKRYIETQNAEILRRLSQKPPYVMAVAPDEMHVVMSGAMSYEVVSEI